MSNATRLVELSMPPPLALEVTAQIASGTGNRTRLIELGLASSLARVLAAGITAHTVSAGGLAELGMATPLAAEIALQINSVVPYLGQIGTRTFIPDSINAGITNQMNIRAEFARDDVTSLQLVYGNFYCSATAEVAGGAARTITASIEYPIGVTLTQVKWGGNASVSIADGAAQVLSDPVAVTIPNGAAYRVRTYQQCAAGIIFASSYKAYGADGDRTHTSNAAVDGTMDLAYAGGSLGGNPFGPYAIIATTTRPSIAEPGDSRGNGANTTGNTSRYVGEVQIGLAPTFGFLDLSRGSQTAEMQAGVQFDKRATYLQYVTHVVVQSGINDLILNGRTAAQVLGYRDAIRARDTSKTWLETTLAPKTTSSDSWATIAGQTIDAVSNGPRITLNTAVRAGRAGFVSYFDTASAVESSLNSGVFTGSPQVAGAVAADGLHLNNFGFSLLPAVIQTSKITR